MENVIMATFPVESEAYQAFSELKRDPASMQSLVMQVVLVKKHSTRLEIGDVFDTGRESRIDTRTGGLIGACLGILGGPVGLLIGSGVGALAGSGAEKAKMLKNQSALEKVSSNLSEGTTAILALVQESDNMVLDSKFSKYEATVTRYDAAQVFDEVEKTAKAQADFEKATNAALYKEAGEEVTATLNAARTKIAAEFDTLKKKLNLL